jgi:hypothetical protein
VRVFVRALRVHTVQAPTDVCATHADAPAAHEETLRHTPMHRGIQAHKDRQGRAGPRGPREKRDSETCSQPADTSGVRVRTHGKEVPTNSTLETVPGRDR